MSKYKIEDLNKFLASIIEHRESVGATEFEYDDKQNARTAVLSFLSQIDEDGAEAAYRFATICGFNEGY